MVHVLVTGCAEIRPLSEVRGMGAKPGPEPTVGACYDAALAPRSMWADGTPAVPCTQTHRAETYHAGLLDAPATKTQAEPSTEQLLTLFTTCEAKAKDFLGGEWYTARLEIELTLPRPDDFIAGVHAYSCEVYEIDQPGHPTAVRRTSSLRGALAAPGPLSMTCFDMRNPPEWAPMVPARCDQPHDAEYVGVIPRQAKPSGTDDEANMDAAVQACRPVVTEYVGARNPRVGWGFIGYGAQVWGAGQLAGRCFALPAEGTKFTASIKGIGNRRPPTT